jgi:hypothetical protein
MAETNKSASAGVRERLVKGRPMRLLDSCGREGWKSLAQLQPRSQKRDPSTGSGQALGHPVC